MQQTNSYHMGHVVLITISAAIGGFLFGFDSSVINGANAALRIHFNTSDFDLAWAVSLTLIGAAVGTYFAGRLADAFGRVKCMLTAAVMFLFSAIGSGMPFGIPDFILWRIIGGVAMGMASIIAPIYIAESAPAKWRGRLGSMQQLAIVVGIFAALLSNYLIVRFAGSANNVIFMGIKAWQLMFWIEVIPAILYAFAAQRLPESPRYLISRGRYDDARRVLAKINCNNVDEEIEAINGTFTTNRHVKLRDLLDNESGMLFIAPVVWAGLGLAIFQQLVGINVIFYYGTMLWQSVGFAESDSFFFSLVSSGINLLMTFVAILLIDKVGRKPLLLIGSFGMTITLATMGICFSNSIGTSNGDLGIFGPIALVAANLYVAFFAATWGPVMWVMLGEMFNNRIRAVAIAVCGLAQWLANFAVTWSFPILTGKNGFGPGPTYIMYAIFAAISIFFVAFFVQETKGRSLEDM